MLPGYRIGRGIGTGARSRIYLAVDARTGQRFAVKRVPRHGPDDDRFLEQAQTEFDVAGKVDHPVLRRCYDLVRIRKFLQTKELYLVMEYVPGVGLDQSMPNRLLDFLNLFMRVSEGLDALHSAGFVHSDIKPNNILIARGGVVKIIDFGQACPLGHRKQRIQGTPDYIAPEQVRRLPLTRQTDVFNLGATMYYLLTLETYPTEVRGADVRGGIAIVDNQGPLAPIEINGKIPLALSNLVMDCCRKEPRDRPGDMRQVRHRLLAIKDVWKKQREHLKLQHLAGRNGQATTPDVPSSDGRDADDAVGDRE